MAKAIMVQGTMSNSGKTFVTAGLCRVFKQDGYKVACLLYTSPSPRDGATSRMPSSA